MLSTSVPNAFAILATLLVLYRPAWSRTSVSAWYAKSLPAPQLIMYDEEKDKIFYSLCNSNSTPIFPLTDEYALDLYQKPLKGTNVAGTVGKDGSILVHYQEEGGGIVQATFYCNTTSGRLTPGKDESLIITGNIPTLLPSLIKTGTDLAVVAPSVNEEDYRVFYKNSRDMPSMLEYRLDLDGIDGGWYDGGVLSQDNRTGVSLAAMYMNRNEMVVLSALSDNFSLALSTKTLEDNEWRIYTYPRLLLSPEGESLTNNTAFGKWTGYGPVEDPPVKVTNITDLAIAFTQGSGGLNTWDIFYIGTDYTLHQLEGDHRYWKNLEQQHPSIWPLADDEFASIAVASYPDTRSLWIYYMSGGNMTQVYMKDGEWQPHITLEKHNPYSPIVDGQNPGITDNTSTEPSVDVAQESAGISVLTREQKIGIGIGVGLGVPILILAIVGFCLYSPVMKRWHGNRALSAAVSREGGAGEVIPQDNKAGAISEMPSSVMSSVQFPFHEIGSPAPHYTSGGYGGQASWISHGTNESPQSIQSSHASLEPFVAGQWHDRRQSQGHQNVSERYSHLPELEPVFEMAHDHTPHELGAGTGSLPTTANTWEMGTMYETQIVAGSPSPVQLATPVSADSSSSPQQSAISPLTVRGMSGAQATLSGERGAMQYETRS